MPAGDAHALAKKIVEVLDDPRRRRRMATRNLEKAKQYRREVLRERRIEFYQRVKEATEAWERACPR